MKSKPLAIIALCFVMTFATCSDDDKESLSAGDQKIYEADGVSFTITYVPGGMTFPSGTDDNGSATVTNSYWIGETEVTYELWEKVRTWAIDAARGANQYTFANVGLQGGGLGGTNQQPVTMINWRSAMAWCNALTEWYNAYSGTSYSCVYYADSSFTTPIRTVDDTGSITYPNPGGQDDPYVNIDANGFRLPTCNESELSARYIDGTTWLYGDHASGDLSGACHDDGSILGGQSLSTVFGDYAVWFSNNPGSTMAVKSKKPNAMDLYDMSGNVSEWCFDWETTGDDRATRGGNWDNIGEYLQVGQVTGFDAYYEAAVIGFRIARTK